MSFTIPVMRMVPGMMSLSVLDRSTQMVPRYWDNGKKKAKDKNMIKGFVPIIAGIPMIKPVAGMVAGL